MSDGNKLDTLQFARPLSLDEMGNILLDAMQGTLICLDNQHIIINVSQTVKRHFGFEQADLIGLSILLLVEESERDSFLKFLNSPPKANDVCYARMMINHITEYRQVKVYRKKKSNNDTPDVHSTTARHSWSIGTVLVITLEQTSFIDITLHDIHKQEFYTKMNLFGEITFEDHRSALITGYLPHELCSKSIFKFVHQEDQLVKLHALWKCVTTGTSKLQWRFIARDGSFVFLQTEYKLIMDAPTNKEIIVARNEVLSQSQIAQFDELQAAWRNQCTADIKGNSPSFKFISSAEMSAPSPVTTGCRILVPDSNIFFTTDKLQPLALVGNIFEGTKLTRPLTLQDYVHILIDNHKHVDPELTIIINNIQSFTAQYRRSNEIESSPTDQSEKINDQKAQASTWLSANELNAVRRTDSESIVRGILRNSSQCTQQKPNDDTTSSTLSRLLNGNNDNYTTPNANTFSKVLNTGSINLQQQHQNQADFSSQPTLSSTMNSTNQLQRGDFNSKYRIAKRNYESQLEALRHHESVHASQPEIIARRNLLLSKLADLESSRNRKLAQEMEQNKRETAPSMLPRQTESTEFHSKMFSPSLSTSNANSSFLGTDFNNTSPSMSSPLSNSLPNPNDLSSSSIYPSTYHQQQQQQTTASAQSSYQTFDSNLTSSYFDSNSQMNNSFFDDFLTPPASSSSMIFPGQNSSSSISVHSQMNMSFPGTHSDTVGQPSVHNNQHVHHHTSTFPF